MIFWLVACGASTDAAYAQEAAPTDKTFDLPEFRECGLVTRYLGAKISPSCLTGNLNALLDENFSAGRRTGYSQYNNTACQDSKSVRGLWAFDATDGTKYMVILSSQSFFKTSGAGDCSQIAGIGPLSASAEVECVQTLGRLWCADGTDSLFSWDGASTAAISGAPIAKHIGAFRNRVWLANISGSLTRIRGSGELDGTDWTLQVPGKSTTPVSIDIAGTNDGDAVNCLMGEYQGAYYIGRGDDLSALYGYDRRDFTLRKISKEIGCIEPKSVQEKNNALYWLSKRGVERLSGTVIDRVSDPIRPILDGIIQAGGNSKTKTLTTEADFEGGNSNKCVSGPNSCMSTTISPGNVVPSSWSVITTGLSALNWTMADVDTTTGVSGMIDNFSGGNLTSDNITWTVRSGAVSVDSSNRMVASSATLGGSASASTSINVTTGTYSFTYISTGTDYTTFRFYFMGDSTDWLSQTSHSYRLDLFPNPTAQKNIELEKINSNVFSDICSAVDATLSNGTTFNFMVSVATNGFMSIFDNGVLKCSGTDSSPISSSNQIVISVFQQSANSTDDSIHIPGFIFPQFYENQVSNLYNTAMSTPTWSSYAINLSSNSSIQPVSILTQTSTSSVGAMSSLLSQTNGSKITSPQRQYFRHEIKISAPLSASVSSVTSVSLSAETTGYYISDCANPSSAITSWGNFRTNTIPNNGSFTFWTATGTTCALASSANANWTAQPANSAITAATSTFISARVLFNLDIATQVPTLNDITFEWNEGGARPPVASAVYRDRYWLFYTTSTASGSANDHALIADSQDKWSLFDDINAYSAAVYNRKLYTGDSASSGLIYQQDSGQSDKGGNFTMEVKTADMDFGNPAKNKILKSVYVYLQPPADQSQSIAPTFNYYVDGSTVPHSLGSVNLNESPEPQGYFVAQLPAPAASPVVFHWLALEMTYTGNIGPLNLLGGKIVYEPTEFR